MLEMVCGAEEIFFVFFCCCCLFCFALLRVLFSQHEKRSLEIFIHIPQMYAKLVHGYACAYQESSTCIAVLVCVCVCVWGGGGSFFFLQFTC